MPTENRSSNTDMVSVPRHTLENVLNDGSCKAEVHAAFIRARHDIERLLTQPAEQHQGEPVALPARKSEPTEESDVFTDAENSGFNACIDEIAKLGPLYSHRVQGEVQALRAQLDDLEQLHGGELGLPKEGWPAYHKRKMESLRDLTAGYYERKLAERNALLRDIASGYWELAIELPADLLARLQAISASAEPSASRAWTEPLCTPDNPCKWPDSCGHCSKEPSAPVERDELVSEEELRDMASIACQSALAHGVSEDWFMQLARSVEQRARAALERKPSTFSHGQIVRKKSGSEWEGRIVGTYSTSLTPEGYCVESSAHGGSVQIYPAGALERKP